MVAARQRAVAGGVPASPPEAKKAAPLLAPVMAQADTKASETVPVTAADWRDTLTFVHPSGDRQYDLVASAACMLVFVCLAAETSASTAYGRFGTDSAVALDPRIGWWLMELPCSLVFMYQFFVVGGPQSRLLVPRLLAFVFCCHYLYRGWIFPARIRVFGESRNFSVVPALFSWMVTTTHAYLNAQWLASHGRHLQTTAWLRSPSFTIGTLLYYVSFVLIIQHDTILRDLRPCPDGERYCIPTAGLFVYATCAQYFVRQPLTAICLRVGFLALTWSWLHGYPIPVCALLHLFPACLLWHLALMCAFLTADGLVAACWLASYLPSTCTCNHPLA